MQNDIYLLLSRSIFFYHLKDFKTQFLATLYTLYYGQCSKNYCWQQYSQVTRMQRQAFVWFGAE